ncbi:MAG: copper resistance protein CopC [Devosia sp.]
MNTFIARLRPALLGLLLAVSWVTTAAAHAQLLGTTPAQNAIEAAAPAEVRLDFSEPVTALAIALIAPEGTRSDLMGETVSGQTVVVSLPSELADGTHVLSWRVVSVDGHPIGGSLVFSVGASSGPATELPATDRLVSLALWAAKALLYGTLLFGVGIAVFSLAAPLPSDLRRPALAMAASGLLLAPVSLGLHGLDALGLSLESAFDPHAWSVGASTSYGPTVLVLEIAFALALVALRAPGVRQVGWLSWLFAALALALSGHASGADPQWLTRPAVFLHLSGILFWAGALLPLLVHLNRRSAEADLALSQFSRFIPLAVAPIIVSGATLAAIQLGVPGPQWLSPYGYLLAAKLGLLALLLALALWNRLGLTAPTLAGEPQPRRHLRLSIRAEIIIVLCILGLVAGWRFTPPPRALAEVPVVVAAEPFFLHLMDADVMVMGTIEPGGAGPVTIDLAVSDASGVPIEAQAVTATFSAPALGIEPFTHEATNLGGAWRVTDLSIPLAGTWLLEIDVRISRFSLVKLQAEIAVP